MPRTIFACVTRALASHGLLNCFLLQRSVVKLGSDHGPSIRGGPITCEGLSFGQPFGDRKRDVELESREQWPRPSTADVASVSTLLCLLVGALMNVSGTIKQGCIERQRQDFVRRTIE